jgi:hypothetical protein
LLGVAASASLAAKALGIEVPPTLLDDKPEKSAHPQL